MTKQLAKAESFTKAPVAFLSHYSNHPDCWAITAMENSALVGFEG
jgi:hypothetical protein